MAIMIPSVISPEVKSGAERKIFEWFRNAPGTDKWIVLHSLGITTHNKAQFLHFQNNLMVKDCVIIRNSK